MLWFTILGVLVVIGYYIILTRRTKRIRSGMTPSQPKPGVEPISIEEARAKVKDIIGKGDKLFVEPADTMSQLSEQLGPITREFFSMYGTVTTRRKGFKLSADDIRTSDYIRGFFSIGHSEDWDVVQRPGSDEVFVVEGSERSESEVDVRFPSIYHLLVDEAEHS
ncbi:MAG: hypothetical protein GC149_14750 [Gammaproteobacteria bacterium]|nr:hypothetical protein [Gammaproteobacteria bacterium]